MAMINTFQMNLLRTAIFVLLATGLTSCNTLGSLMNSSPFRLLDETASSLVGLLAENDEGARSASMEERARQIEARGVYAGQSPAAATGLSTGVASR
jgi:hypothetical protein